MSEQKDKNVFKDQPKSNSQNNSSTVKPISKQLAHYNKNKDRINDQRKIDYHNKAGKTNNREKTKTPCPKNNNKNISIMEPERTPTKPFSRILNLENVLNLAVEIHKGNLTKKAIIYRFGNLRNGKAKRIRKEPIYTEILEYIPESYSAAKLSTPNWKSETEIYEHFKKINPRTLRSKLVNLQKLHWIRRHGRDYHLNPFLFQLFKIDENFLLMLEFASLKVDFFNVLNLPLIEASNSKITDTKIDYKEVSDKYFNEIFKGKMLVTLTLEDGSKAQTLLPVNVHPQNAYGEKVAHYCIPIDCGLFDLTDEPYFSTDYKRPHRKGAINENWNIHADKSITIPYMTKKTLHPRYKIRFHQQKVTSIKHWQERTYLETDHIEKLNILFNERFVNQKRGTELYSALDMTLKPKGGRPNGSKNKPKKINIPKALDILSLTESEPLPKQKLKS
jgi:hypothetical protein